MAERTLKEDLHADLGAAKVKDVDAAIAEFDLLSVPADAEDLVHESAKKVKERVDAYSHFLEDLLQPDTSLAAMNECSFFTEQELEHIVKLYRKLMALSRSYTLTDLNGQDYGAYLVAALAEWKALKPQLVKIAEKIQKGWEQDQPLQREKGYFG